MKTKTKFLKTKIREAARNILSVDPESPPVVLLVSMGDKDQEISICKSLCCLGFLHVFDTIRYVAGDPETISEPCVSIQGKNVLVIKDANDGRNTLLGCFLKNREPKSVNTVLW